MNDLLPPYDVWILDSFLYGNDSKRLGRTAGVMVSVRSQCNQSLQFQVLLENGALFTGLPAHSISFSQDTDTWQLTEAQMWDNISDRIQVICLELLRFMPVEVRLASGTKKVQGTYLFSIDYVGANDLSRHPSQWKMVHVIKAQDGQMLIYPQYRIRFLDLALCEEASTDLPSYTYNEQIWYGGS